MDNLNVNEQEKDESSLENLTKKSIIIVSGTGEVHLQLEGSHTSSTETESQTLNGKEKKNVKFEDEITVEKAKTPEKSPRNSKEKKKQSQEILEIIDTKESLMKPVDKSEFKQIGQQNQEIAERFKQIMEMFENFSRNLESLDLETTHQRSGNMFLGKTKRKRAEGSHSNENIKKQRKDLEVKILNEQQGVYKDTTFKDYFTQEKSKENITEINGTALYSCGQQMEPLTTTISTNTSSCDFFKPKQNFGSQTLGSDHYSLNDLSLLEVSSVTSHSEASNSLNNYAQAENALEIRQSPPQMPFLPSKPLKVEFQETMATTLTEPLSQVVVEQQPCNQNVHTIHIETNAIPSVSDLRRLPLCQRLWTVIADFCAATFLCLQVNRDCIFCLGFFAAFVVSASFLTAFFYHTLNVSPSIWQTPDNIRL